MYVPLITPWRNDISICITIQPCNIKHSDGTKGAGVAGAAHRAGGRASAASPPSTSPLPTPKSGA